MNRILKMSYVATKQNGRGPKKSYETDLQIQNDPLFFTKGESYVMRTIAMYSSWGTSLTINEKVTSYQQKPHCAILRL